MHWLKEMDEGLRDPSEVEADLVKTTDSIQDADVQADVVKQLPISVNSC